MQPVWIVTEIGFDEHDGGWLIVWGININHDKPSYGETERYFKWRVRELNERYDIGLAKLHDSAPFARLQGAFGLPAQYKHGRIAQ